MANKLAGQRAKFSRARATYYTALEEPQRLRAVQLMVEVLRSAPSFGFSEDEVTQGEEPPSEVRLLINGTACDETLAEGDEQLSDVVDCRDVRRFGSGEQFVYAYGYRCAPDRLKIGSAVGDPIARIAAQISTGTPDRPAARLFIATHDCRALERVLHGVLRLRKKQVFGAGSEWFITSVEEIEEITRGIGVIA